MDFKRIFLILGLIIVGYLMILKWNQEHQYQIDNDKKITDAHQPHEKLNEHSHLPSANLPSDAPKAVEQSNDAPKIEVNKTQPNTVHKDLFITAVTDNLKIKIDPYGGNIVYLALLKYPEKQGNSAPFVLLDKNERVTFIAQSGLIGENGPDAHGLPLYKAALKNYTLRQGEKELNVDLHLEEKGVNITKRYTFTRGDYAIKLTYIINNTTQTPWSGNFYAQLKRDNSHDPDMSTTSISSYLGAAVKSNDKKFKKLKFDSFESSPFRETVTGGYAAILQHYFVTAWVPAQNQQFVYSTRKVAGDNIVGFYGKTAVTAAPEAQAEISAKLYAGPKIGESLEKLASGLELTIDYGWLWFIAAPMFAVLAFLHKLFGNWGWSIIVLTTLIKLLFYPLANASYRSMARMRSLQPKMQALKERYGDDRQKMSQELMALYKKEKVNPMGGCLPILVQMPFFVALYEVLIEAVQLRQVPWIFWIHDLSRMDPYFILPIIMGGLMLIQQRLNPAPPDPTQAKIMKFMPVMFTIFFLWFPAGLVIYWVTNNFLSILQQWWITKKYEQQMAQAKKK
ncbi:MAG: membrane protein insertase YidC [Endozoicomonadaceae bacterium]|nr:membrane protein insertase YidC [Endozoicomonadaceae bacterium]